MKARFLILNFFLAVAIAAVGWKAKVERDESRAKRAATLRVPVKPAVVPPIAHVPKPDAVAPAKYNDVAQKNLFAKDRNPQVVIEPPKEPEKPKPMPKLPVVYGVMGLPSGVKAVMAAGGASKIVKTGDAVGEFKILALDTKQVTFEWNDKKVTKDIEELVERGGPPEAQASAQSNAGGPAVAPAAATGANMPPRSGPEVKPEPAKGVEIGSGTGPSVKSCAPGDNTPAGAVVDGYKKISEATPFGPACRWVKQ